MTSDFTFLYLKKPKPVVYAHLRIKRCSEQNDIVDVLSHLRILVEHVWQSLLLLRLLVLVLVLLSVNNRTALFIGN